MVQAPQSVHVVLTVRDDGSPNLYSYKRLVVTILPPSQRGHLVPAQGTGEATSP